MTYLSARTDIGEGVQRVWSGIMSKTPDHLPLVGQYAPNAYLSVGMNGHGMAVGFREDCDCVIKLLKSVRLHSASLL